MYVVDGFNLILSLIVKPILFFIVLLMVLRYSRARSPGCCHWLLFLSGVFGLLLMILIDARFNIAIPILTSDSLNFVAAIIDTREMNAFSLQQYHFWYVIVAVYFIVFLTLFFLRVYDLFGALRLVENSQLIADTRLLGRYSDLCKKMAINNPPSIYVSEELLTPVVWGKDESRILVPNDFYLWDEGRQIRVLSHELAHIERSDSRTKLISYMVASCFWFIPLLWFWNRRINWYAELACDDRVVDMLNCRAEYAEDLLELGARVNSNRSLLAYGQFYTLNERLENVLDPARERTLGVFSVRLMYLLTAIIFACFLAVIHPVKKIEIPDYQSAVITYLADSAIDVGQDDLGRSDSSVVPIFPSKSDFVGDDRREIVKIHNIDYESISQNLPREELVSVKYLLPMNKKILEFIRDYNAPSVEIVGHIPLHMVAPVYPKLALKRNIEGDVIVNFDISESGTVTNIKVIKSLPKGVFDQSVKDALHESKFSPAFSGGTAVSVLNVKETYRFNID